VLDLTLQSAETGVAACWRLSHALKCEVWAVSDTVRAARDFKFCDQLLDAAASAPSNISEGFGRFNSKEFAYFLSVARARA
jgi:four helix bundle protein